MLSNLIAAATDASTESSKSSGSSPLITVGFFGLMFAGLYFLMIRPQRRRARDQQKLQRSVEVGDEIETTSGMRGFITGIDEADGIVWVEIDDNVQVRFNRGAVARVIRDPATAEAEVVGTPPSSTPLPASSDGDTPKAEHDDADDRA